MFFPLYDSKFGSNKFPTVTLFLIGANALLFIILAGSLYLTFGVVPGKVLANKNLYTLITSLFLHVSFWHLLVNMWFLWLFGDNVEQRLGHFRFVIFYLFCGALANLGYAFLATQKTLPLIGASGAISAILGGYLSLYPSNRIEGFLILPPFLFKRISLSAGWFFGFWFVIQLVAAVFLTGSMTAYWAHIIGFLSGFSLARLFAAPAT